MHTFSFGSYYDPEHMGVSVLRVINDDRVIPGAGFATHSHRDMEIISYVKRGTIEHKDSMGNIKSLPAGEFQLMSAGTGVNHSEYNPSDSEPLEFLQIWIVPDEPGIEPRYQQKRFADQSGLQLITAPDGRDGSLLIHQQAELWQLKLDKNEQTSHTLSPGRTVYVHVIAGSLSIDGENLEAGDGATLNDMREISFQAGSKTEALVFDLP
jgi:redox-sensitive bicupin YhaK (pirin superfamily)